MQILNFIFEFTDKTKSVIEEIEKMKNLVDNGPAKKQMLDETMVHWVEQNYNKLVKINFLMKGSVKKAIILMIPRLTQKIYDLIRIKIMGIGN